MIKLLVPEGEYVVEGSRWPLLRLTWLVICHRTWHWWRGEGWVD